MSEFEYELVNDTINADGPAGELELGVGRIVKDEVVLVKVSELRTSDTAGHLDLDQPHEVPAG